MNTYMFYVIKADGSSVSLEVHALASDEVASDRAVEVLANHPGAEYVAVTRGLHPVATHHRDAVRKPKPAPAVVAPAAAAAAAAEPAMSKAEDVEARIGAVESLLTDLLRRDPAFAQTLLDAERAGEPASEAVSRVSAARRRILSGSLRG